MIKFKLGIFGDSFADDTHGHDNFPELNKNAWFYHLGEEYKVTSYGVAGVSNFYSYEKFIANQEKFDKIIFLITLPDRHPSFEIDIKRNSFLDFMFKPKTNSEYIKKYPCGEKIAEYLISNAEKYNLNNSNIQKLKAVQQYYQYLIHKDYDYTMSNLMIKDIKNIRPDAIIINLFYEMFYSVPKEKWGKPIIENIKGPTFVDYLDVMIKNLDIKDFNTYEFPNFIRQSFFEKRCVCHFSEEINLLLANHIKEALTIGEWNPIIPDVIFHKNVDLNYYYDIHNPWKTI